MNKNRAKVSEFSVCAVRTERMTYHAMMAAKQLNPKKDNHGDASQDENKLNFIVLPERFLNLRANMGNLRYQKETGITT